MRFRQAALVTAPLRRSQPSATLGCASRPLWFLALRTKRARHTEAGVARNLGVSGLHVASRHQVAIGYAFKSVRFGLGFFMLFEDAARSYVRRWLAALCVTPASALQCLS